MLSVKARALRLLALREHSRAEIERKLCARTGTGSDDADPQGDLAPEPLKTEVQRVLDELERHGLLSDQRTAAALLQAKAPRFGSRRLKQMLQAKSLDAELVADTLRQASASELDRARAIWRRRFGVAPADPHQRARQQRFLAGRGFEAAVIERVLKEARHDAGQRTGTDPD